MMQPHHHGAEDDPDAVYLASSSVENGYLGWWYAASRHGFTTQVPHAIHVATDVDVPDMMVFGAPVSYVRLPPIRFFGWQDMTSYGRTVRISTPAKTVVDCAFMPEYAGGVTEVARIVSQAAIRVEAGDLVDATARFGSASVAGRLGYLLDLTAPGFLSGSMRDRLRGMALGGERSILGHGMPCDGGVGHVEAWNIGVNARLADILAEIG